MRKPERRPGVWQWGWFQVLYGWRCGLWANPENQTEGEFVFYGLAFGETFWGIVR